MKPTLLLACLFCAGIPAVAFADGEKQYPDYNFAITPPNGWLDNTASAGQKGVIALFGSPDQTRAVFVLVEDRAAPTGEWNEASAAEFDRTAEPNLGKRLSGRFVSVQGIKSYERTSAPVVQGQTISMISRTTPVGTRFYSLQGYHFAGGDAGEDPQVREFLESFRFLTPPPGASSAAVTKPAPAPAGEHPSPPVIISVTATQPAPAPAAKPAPPVANSTAVTQPAPVPREAAPPASTVSSATETQAKDRDNAFSRGRAVGRMMAILLTVGLPILIIVWFVRRGKGRAQVVPHTPSPSPQPQSTAPPGPPAPTELHPPPPTTAPPAPLRPAHTAVSRAAPPSTPSAPPILRPARTAQFAARPARPASPPSPPAAPTPFSAPPASGAPPSAPPAASPSPPAPPQAPLPRPFVIRPRQRHMRG